MSRVGRLRAVLAANLTLVGALIAIGIIAHSLGVWAEGADYLADAAAIGVSLLVIHLATRPPTPRHPNGYPKATHLAAVVNAASLLVLSVLVAAGAVDRLARGVRHVDGLLVLIVSGGAALVMLGGALLLGGDANGEDVGGDLNVRAVLLDTVADAVAAAGVAAAGGVIYAVHGLYWLDPTVALIIAVVVGYHAARLLARIRDSLTAPGGRSR